MVLFLFILLTKTHWRTFKLPFLSTLSDIIYLPNSSQLTPKTYFFSDPSIQLFPRHFNYHSYFFSVQFSSVAQSCLTLCDPMNRRASLSITNSRSSLRLTSIESVMPSSHLILCFPLFLLPPIPPSISLFQWVNSSHEVAKVLEFLLKPQNT